MQPSSKSRARRFAQMSAIAAVMGLFVVLAGAPGGAGTLGRAKELSNLEIAEVPESERPAPKVTKPVVPVRPPAGKVALTFDDGPDPTYTPKVLDILDRYGVKATFFVIGSNVKLYPKILEEIRRRGHVIANHSVSHPQLPKLSPDRLEAEIAGASTMIEDVTDEAPMCMRPPYGARNANVDARIRANGMEMILWQVDTNDWKKPGAGSIESAGSQADGTEVVLMHDGGGERTQTVAALPGMIENLRSKGLAFSPVCGYPRSSLTTDAF